MTINAIGRFNGLYNNVNKLIDNRIPEILNQIKYDIINDNIEHDCDISISSIELTDEPSIYSTDGIGVLTMDITILTLLNRVKIRKYDYDWDYLVQKGYQTKNDYTYDQGFFHIARANKERYCE